MAVIQLKRGTAAAFANYVLERGEPFWCTDENALYIGDRTTAGKDLEPLVRTTHETWAFELEDGSTVEKEVVLWISAAS